jgi:hypothetical protein
MSNKFEVWDGDARSLFAWIIERFQRSGNLIARHESDVPGLIAYAALRVPSGEIGLLSLSETASRASNGPRYTGLGVGWTRDVSWGEGHVWKHRPTDTHLALNDYATYEEALEVVETR